MGARPEERPVSKALVKGYAQGRLLEAVRSAEDFVNRAQEALRGHAPPRAGNSFDALLARTLVRRGLLRAAQLKECLDDLAAARWLPVPVPLREAILRRGFVDKKRMDAVVAELVETAAEMNRAYGETAVRMGYVSDQQMQDCLSEVDPAQAKFALPRICKQRGLIDQEQHERIAQHLREEIERFAQETQEDAEAYEP